MRVLALACPLFLTQNNGTLTTAASAARLPIRTFASGPRNSMRGAAFLAGLDDRDHKAPGADADASSNAGKTFAITSVAWAPSCGRSYHLVATGSRDGHVRIWRVKPPTPSEDLDGGGEDGGDDGAWSASIVGDFDDHRATVGRVEWNITGCVGLRPPVLLTR